VPLFGFGAEVWKAEKRVEEKGGSILLYGQVFHDDFL
jgi:hypothetical protein